MCVYIYSKAIYIRIFVYGRSSKVWNKAIILTKVYGQNDICHTTIYTYIHICIYTPNHNYYLFSIYMYI